MTEIRRNPGLPARATSTLPSDDAQCSRSDGVASRSVSWWSVHEFVQKYLETAGHYPTAGTPAWCELADGDRRKWAALLDFAQHHALRVETAQQQQAQASRDISAATNWTRIGAEVVQRNEFRDARPWIKRRAA